eukprot:14851865-Alexandrium_andersonii.AAC.1
MSGVNCSRGGRGAGAVGRRAGGRAKARTSLYPNIWPECPGNHGNVYRASSPADKLRAWLLGTFRATSTGLCSSKSGHEARH